VTRWRWISVAVVVFAVIYALWHGDFSEWSYLALRRREAGERTHLVALKHTVDSLKAFRDSLATNPDVQERVAREQYGMLKPGEQAFLIEWPDSLSADSVRADSPF
jgi:cell division protein FtsB